jgi:hypothetical protein
MDIAAIAEKLEHYTSGYPFLVSNLCKIIDEKMLLKRENRNWSVAGVDEAFRLILKEQNTNFDDLIKNLQAYDDIFERVQRMLIDGIEFSFNIDNPLINLGVAFGIFKEVGEKLRIHNKVYENRIYNYISSLHEDEAQQYNFQDNFILDGRLDMQQVLLKFQQFMKENHAERDKSFLEHQGRILFLAFIKPILNGKGFDFKEVEVSYERRIDVVITFLNQKHVAELKIWRGEAAHQKGLEQLSGYLDNYGLKEGYLLIYDSRKEKEYKTENIEFGDKKIFAAWV